MKCSVAVLVTLAAACTATAASASGGEQQRNAPQTITFVQDNRHGDFAFVDNIPHSPDPNPDSPKARFSLGDQAFFHAVLLDQKGGSRIGHVYATETVVRGSHYPNVTNMIHAVLVFNDGQVVVDAIANEAHPSDIRAAVTGGTGAYEGAIGTLIPPSGSRHYFELHLQS
jgi:hypothetical protein